MQMEGFSFSTFSAVSEIFVTIGVLTIVYQNYQQRPFNGRLALGLVLFEFFVNMLYMISRMDHHSTTENPIWFKLLAAVHGSLSLLVFIAFAVYAALAYSDSKRGVFFFKEHPSQTKVFVFLWMVSVLSGEALYFLK
jgi:uncharacterized membrane protein YozB (DUF420 family)